MRDRPQARFASSFEQRLASADVLLCVIVGDASVVMKQRGIHAGFLGLAIPQQRRPIKIVAKQPVAVRKHLTGVSGNGVAGLQQA